MEDERKFRGCCMFTPSPLISPFLLFFLLCCLCLSACLNSSLFPLSVLPARFSFFRLFPREFFASLPSLSKYVFVFLYIPVPILFLDRKPLTSPEPVQPQAEQGEVWWRGRGWGGSVFVKLRVYVYFIERRIPLPLPSCRQLDSLCEGNLHCFLFTLSLYPWLIPLPVTVS